MHTSGSSIMAAAPSASVISAKPPPEVAHIARAAGVRGADGHVDDAKLVFDLADHDARARARARAIQCSTPVDGLIG